MNGLHSRKSSQSPTSFNIFIVLLVCSSLCVSTIAESCRCSPNEACWPGQREWAAFNASVHGKLVSTTPIAAVCHNSFLNKSTLDLSQCADLQAAWHVPQVHASTSYSVMAPFWANQSCDPFSSIDSQCIIGTYVQYAVNATNTSDFKKSLAFAAERNIRLVVRNTGHDYFGKSSGTGALAIWTHHIRTFEVMDYFSKEYAGKAVKVGAGLQIMDATSLAHRYGLTIVGGACSTVGLAGGYTQGGGHGPLLSKYGFGADQVLEWEVVTLDGQHLRVSSHQHPKLYWALSGGGGGTYALVLSMIVKAYPNEVTAAANLTFTNQGIPQDDFYKAVEVFHKCLPALTNAGGVAVWTLEATEFSLAPATGPGMTKAEMDHFFYPALQALTDLHIQYSYYSLEFPSYYDSDLAMNPATETSIFQIGSRLLPPSVLSSNSSELIEALARVISYGAAVGGLAFKAPANSTFSNSVNPVLRESMLSFVVGTWWNNTNWQSNLENQVLMTDTLIPLLDELTPEGGSAYLNEGNFQESNWQQVFYGANYDSLRSIKREYDPKGILWGRTAVGSEAWVEHNDGRLCRVGS